MTVGEEQELALKIINPEQFADTLLQSFWRAKGHNGDIKDLPSYPKAKEKMLRRLSSDAREIGEHTAAIITALEYGHYSVGEYKFVGCWAW